MSYYDIIDMYVTRKSLKCTTVQKSSFSCNFDTAHVNLLQQNNGNCNTIF